MALAAMAVLGLAACGSDDDTESAASADEITMSDPWSRRPADGQTTSAVYGEVTNNTGDTITAISATASVSDTVELHEVLMNDEGQMSMQEREGGYEIAAGETFVFEPGGPHIMLLDIDAATYPETVDVTLSFDNDVTIEFVAEVREIGDDAMDMGGMDDGRDGRRRDGDGRGLTPLCSGRSGQQLLPAAAWPSRCVGARPRGRHWLPMSDGPDVAEFQSEVAQWLAANADRAPRDYGAICPPDLIDQGIAWQRTIRDAGYAGIHWPTEFGGRGLSAEHNGVWMLECARAGVPPVLNMVGLVLTGGAVLRYGTPEQQHRHLLATLDAEHVWCQLFSEPGSGSDLASLSTRAERDGDRYIVNGQKVWCSGGRYSNWGILMARTDPDARNHAGISFFLCPMDLPGIEIRPLKQMTGESEFDEVFFTDVELPADHLLGPSTAAGVSAWRS